MNLYTLYVIHHAWELQPETQIGRVRPDWTREDGIEEDIHEYWERHAPLALEGWPFDQISDGDDMVLTHRDDDNLHFIVLSSNWAPEQHAERLAELIARCHAPEPAR